jgi:UDPglucose 6-dehydrogenase
MRASIVGLGKLGSPLLAVLAAKGFDVIGVDRSAAYVAAVEDGRAPVNEPGLQELFDQARLRIRGTEDIHHAVSATDVTFVVVPTPSKADGTFSNSQVLSAITEIGVGLRRKQGYHLVVITSTVMPGSMNGPIRQALEAAADRKVGSDLGLCYNPEFVALGNVIHDMLYPDFILIGESDARAGDTLASIHAKICNNRPSIQRMNFVNAEITKIAVNSFVTTKISFANTISQICDHFAGADATAITNALGCDRRIGHDYLLPALGYGGPCFPRDNAAFSAVAHQVGTRADIAQATDAINRRQVARVVRLVRSLLPGGTVGVLGLSYKPNTAVIEDSQGVAIAAELAAAGYRVIISDPQSTAAATAVLGNRVEPVPEAGTCAEMSDLLIIATPWPAFRELPREALQRSGRRVIIVDCWGLLPAEDFRDVARLVYLGRPSPGPGDGSEGESVESEEDFGFAAATALT